MSRQFHRRFLISDAMVLVAACAVGFGLTRAIVPDLEVLRPGARTGISPGMRRFFLVEYSLDVVGPTLVAWTLALLLIRLLQPRPRLRRLFVQPGAAACAIATIVMTIETILTLALLAVGSQSGSLLTAFVGYARLVSFAVLGGWLALALTGRWRPEPSWIDRAGRVTAAAWFAITAIEWSSHFFM